MEGSHLENHWPLEVTLEVGVYRGGSRIFEKGGPVGKIHEQSKNMGMHKTEAASRNQENSENVMFDSYPNATFNDEYLGDLHFIRKATFR